MKRFSQIMMLIICLGAFSSLQGQVEIGATAGLNLSQMNLNVQDLTLQDIQRSQGLKVAGVFNVKLGKFLRFQPEIGLSQKGFNFMVDSATVRHMVSNYLEVPLMAQVRVKLWKIRAHLDAGPSISYMGKAVQFDELSTGDVTAKKVIEFADNINRLELGFNVGATAGVKLGPGWLEVSARSFLGLTDVFASGPNPLFNGLNSTEAIIETAKHNVNAISLSYLISIGK